MRTLALLGALATVVGLVIAVLAFAAPPDRSVPPPSSGGGPVNSANPKSPAPQPLSPLQEVAALATGVQFRKFAELLGEPDRRREVGNSQAEPTTYKESIWERPSYVLQVVTDSQDTVVLYTVTTMDPNFHPEIPFKIGKNNGSIQLGLSKFSDIEPSFIGIDASYPADAQYHYTERYGRGFELQYRTLLLTQSWDATGIESFDSAGGYSLFEDFNLVSASCYDDFESCDTAPANEAAALDRLRAALVISGFTVTEPDFDTESISIQPNPGILNSRCELPVGC